MSVVVAKVNEWAVKANDTPTFLIKVPRGDSQPPVYYLVIAHWEYDKSRAQTAEEAEGCDSIAAEFDALPDLQSEARKIDSGSSTSKSLSERPVNTNPRN